VITTLVGGTGEAVGDTAVIVEPGNVGSLTRALDRVVLEMPEHERHDLERRGREHALAFDRARVFDDLFGPRTEVVPAPVRLQASESV
jgi:glycogen synthase